MPVASTLELPGSPLEIASFAPQTTVYWDPTAELAAGETIGTPTAKVLQYDPAYPYDTKDVTSSLLAAGSPALGSGAHAGQVQITVAAGAAIPGYEYRVQATCQGSLGTNPARFFRLRCLV